MSDKMREEFEIWYAEHEKSRLANGWLPLGGFVKGQMLKAFIGSRESLVVELPKIVDKEWACTLAECSAMRDAIGMCKKRIESLGLRVKP